jgi:hypothetical protein
MACDCRNNARAASSTPSAVNDTPPPLDATATPWRYRFGDHLPGCLARPSRIILKHGEIQNPQSQAKAGPAQAQRSGKATPIGEGEKDRAESQKRQHGLSAK